ncbi:putative Phage shock protein A (PspA) [Thiomonas sp. X19]|uniref:PspA/IM30 family protein n=1 Tax=Thiomonas sp. X19 TaxID=1050370 RepID=UPI000B6B6DF3|nr:PspA/IM30 family protein [Thiomonas sp. X19]SCC94214.1 putative Phage shock protein A (PspA) [Thiomonas sp. X19]
MSMFKHAAEILEARVNTFLNRADDPAQTLDLSYEKMITTLQDTKRHLADVITERISLENQMAAAKRDSDKAETDARMALQAQREDLARAALAEKQSALQKIDALQQAHDGIATQAEKLTAYETRLQDRIEQFRTQKEVMKTQMTAAAAEVGVSESLSGLGTGLADAGDAMRRAQDKTAQMQAKAEAMEGMTEVGILSDPLDARDSTEKELDKLRSTTGVDADLARLKAEMTAPK